MVTNTDSNYFLPQFLAERENMVDRYYVMDPEAEELLFDASEIRRNFVVLIAAPSYRVAIESYSEDEPMPADVQHKALINNRWGAVERLEVDSTYIHLVCVYGDGTKFKRSIHLEQPWLVKKSSLPYRVHD
jgi:hypothetical protein